MMFDVERVLAEYEAEKERIYESCIKEGYSGSGLRYEEMLSDLISSFERRYPGIKAYI